MRAWIVFVLMPALFVVISSIMGNLESDPSFGVQMSIFAAFVAVLLLLAGLAIRFGRRARRDGRASGLIPATLGGAFAGFFTLLALATLIGHLFGME